MAKAKKAEPDRLRYLEEEKRWKEWFGNLEYAVENRFDRAAERVFAEIPLHKWRELYAQGLSAEEAVAKLRVVSDTEVELVQNPDVFDLDAEGIALPGETIRLLGEYAQGKGPAKALYVKATDHELVSSEEIAMAIAELLRQNERLNSGELDRLVRELQQQIAQPNDGDDDERLSFDLSEEEEASLQRLSWRNTWAKVLYDAYDPSELTISRERALAAFFMAPGLVQVRGTLAKKIEQLWDDADAMEEWHRREENDPEAMERREREEGWHEEDQD